MSHIVYVINCHLVYGHEISLVVTTGSQMPIMIYRASAFTENLWDYKCIVKIIVILVAIVHLIFITSESNRV